MAFTEKRKYWRLREKVKGVYITLIPNLGTREDDADDAKRDYEKAKAQGYVFNPESDHVLHDIRQFIKAKAAGIDLNEPAKGIPDALAKWLASTALSSKTRFIYETAVRQYCDHSKAKTLPDMSVDSVNAWRVAMENGVLTYTRGGKDKNRKEIRYRYSPWTIGISLSSLRTFCNYCVFRGWMSADPSNKSKPLNPFSQIVIRAVEGEKRYLTRPEAARLLWACRLEKFEARGNQAIPDKVRSAIFDMALKRPELGKWKIKRQLEKQGFKVKIGTIDWLFRRNDLRSERDRRRAAAGSFVPATTVIANSRVNSDLRKWIHFDLYTGLREAEVRRARCQDIITHQVVDPDAKMPIPVTVYGLQVMRPSKGGQKKFRIVWFPPNAARIHGIRKKFGKTGPLLSLMGTSGLAKARRLAARRAGLGRVRYHDLRHSFARNFLLSGNGNLPGLQQALGHSRLSTTGIYSNFANTDLAGASAKFRLR